MFNKGGGGLIRLIFFDHGANEKFSENPNFAQKGNVEFVDVFNLAMVLLQSQPELSERTLAMSNNPGTRLGPKIRHGSTFTRRPRSTSILWGGKAK